MLNPDEMLDPDEMISVRYASTDPTVSSAGLFRLTTSATVFGMVCSLEHFPAPSEQLPSCDS